MSLGVAAPPAQDLRLTRQEKVGITLLYAAIIGVTVLAFAAAFVYLPHYSKGQVSTGLFLFTGLAITAYILGVRHGFDVDHIAAIDNTTRKLLNENKRPLTVGTWFSLGHSTIVCGLVVALVLATEFIKSHFNQFLAIGSIVGTLVSGTFLIIIGLVNLIIVAEVYRIFKG